MTNKQKKEYAEKVNERFINARNHGNGGNWWYPKENRIAYNVKMYAWIDVKDVRENMTPRQNEYYSDEVLLEIIQEKQANTANFHAEEIEGMNGVIGAGYHGRSAGWLEVDYRNGLCAGGYSDCDTKEHIQEQYEIAKELEKNEDAVSQYIAKELKAYKKYIGSAQAAKDTVDGLMADDEIAEIYKDKIKTLADKLK